MASPDDDIKDLGKAAKESKKSVDELKTALESLFQKGGLTPQQKKDIAEMANKYKDIKKALEGINTQSTTHKKDAKEILDISEDLQDVLENTKGLYESIKKELEGQVKELNKQSSIQEKLSAIDKIKLGNLAKNRILLQGATDSVKEMLGEANKMEATALFSKDFQGGAGITEDMIQRLKELGVKNKIIDSVNKKIIQKKQLELELQEAQASGFDDLAEALEYKILKTQKSINRQISRNNSEILEGIQNHKKSAQSLYSEVKVRNEIEDIFQTHKRDLDETYTKYAAISSLIPGIGKSLSKAFLEAKDISIDALSTVKDTFLETQDPIKALQAGWSKLNKGLGATVGIIAIVLLLTKAVFDLFKGINQQTTAIQAQTGLASDQAYNLYKNALSAQTQFKNQLSTIEDIVAVQTSFINTYGRMVELSEEVLTQISDASKVLGYSAETAGQLQTTFMQLGADEGLAGNLQLAVGNLAKANKIAPGVIAKDLVENAEYIATVFAGMPKQAALAAVEVRKMGFSLAQAAKVSQFLFDIPGSLTAAMEASVGLGRLIDTNAARAYAMQGDTAKMMDEITKQAGSYAEFSEMSVAQRMLLADAFGMEVNELQRSMYIRENLSDLSDEEYKAAEKHLKTLENVEKMDKAQLQAEISKAQQAEKFEVAMSKIKNALTVAILPAAEALLPVMETLSHIMSALAPVIKLIGKLFWLIGKAVELILSPLTLINNIITHGFTEGISKTADGFNTVWGIIKLITAGLIGIPLIIMGATKLLGGLGSIMKGGFSVEPVKNFFKTATSGGKGLKETLTSAFSKVKEGVFGKSTEAGGKRSGGLMDRFRRRTEPESTPASQSRSSRGRGRARGSGGAGGGGGGMLGSLSQTNTTSLIKGAAAMLIVSAAVYVFAKALQELEKIKDWQTIAIGLGAFAATMGLIAIVGRPAQAGLQALGQGLMSFGAIMLAGGWIGLAILTAAVIAFGAALRIAAPGIEAFSSVIEKLAPVFIAFIEAVRDVIGNILSTIYNTITYVFDNLTFEKAAAILAISASFFSLGAALGVFAASAVFGAVGIVGLMGILLILGKIAETYSEPIQIMADSIASLVSNLKQLETLDLSKISENLKKVGEMSSSATKEISKSVTPSTTIPQEIQQTPISNTTEQTKQTTTTPTFDQRNEALGGNNTAALLARLVTLMESNASNPPRLVLEFSDGTISEIKGRIKKTM
jgi:hypothetical protein